jgi:N-methylhydantoinase A
LGYLSPDSFKNSGIVVSPQLAADAIEKTLAAPLRTSVQRAARAVRETINENVARAFRVHAGELGLDYRNYALVCTGGSAPLHAAEIARILHIKRVIFPFGAGVSSAFGLFAGREGLTLQRTNVVELRALEAGRVGAEVAAMIASDTYAVALSAAGADTTLSLGLRYVGQGYEVSVKIGSPNNSSANSIREAFEQEYLRIFGTTFPDYVIEIFNWTLQISAPRRLVELSGYRYSRIEARGQKRKGERSITEVGGSTDVSVPVYDRYALKPGDIIEGGAVVEESDTTILLPTFARAVVQDSYDILAEIKPAR